MSTCIRTQSFRCRNLKPAISSKENSKNLVTKFNESEGE